MMSMPTESQSQEKATGKQKITKDVSLLIDYVEQKPCLWNVSETLMSYKKT